MFRFYGTNQYDLLHSLVKPISFVCSTQELITFYDLRVFYYHHDTLSLRLVALSLSKTNWLVFCIVLVDCPFVHITRYSINWSQIWESSCIKRCRSLAWQAQHGEAVRCGQSGEVMSGGLVIRISVRRVGAATQSTQECGRSWRGGEKA